MAWHSDRGKVKESTNVDKFNKIWKLGENPVWAGIYRCQACGYEDVINRGCTKLPPCSNCEKKNHKNNTWKLLARAEDAE